LDDLFELTCNRNFDLAKVRSLLLHDFERLTTLGRPVVSVKGNEIAEVIKARAIAKPDAVADRFVAAPCAR
jgi:hypothetical protein